MLVEITHEIEREGVSAIVRVEGEVEPYVPARTWGDPGDCYPAEGGDAEILSAEVDTIYVDGEKVPSGCGFVVGEEPELTDAEGDIICNLLKCRAEEEEF